MSLATVSHGAYPRPLTRLRNSPVARRWVHCMAVLLVSAVLGACAKGEKRSLVQQQLVAQDPAAMLRIAQAAASAGEWGSAETFYRRAMTLRPDNAQACIGYSQALAEQDRLDDAIAVLQQAHARQANNIEINVVLGRLLAFANRPRDALALFDAALARSPATADLLVGRGVTLDLLNRHGEAQASYRKALLIDAGNLAARRNLLLSSASASSSPTQSGR